jgi:hypothetical protein
MRVPNDHNNSIVVERTSNTVETIHSSQYHLLRMNYGITMSPTSVVHGPHYETKILAPIILDSPSSIATKHALFEEQQQGVSKRRRLSTSGRAVKRIKHVRFAPANRIYEANPAHTSKSNKGLTWFTKQELDFFRSRAKALAVEISNNPHMKDHALSYRNVLESAYRECLFLEEEGDQEIVTVNKGLWVWVSHGHSRRGLERWSVPSMGIHRQERRCALVHTVMIVQQQSMLEKEAALRQLSERYSLPSRVMSRALGAADAHAVTESSEVARGTEVKNE